MLLTRLLSPLALLACLGGCGPNTAQRQIDALSLPSADLGQRQRQTRHFATSDEALVLSSAIGVLQDLGFIIEESASGVGMLVAAKDRDATEAQQVAGQMFAAALASALTGVNQRAEWDHNQKIRIALITKKSNEKTGLIVRATFQRVVISSLGRVSKVETLDDPLLYQEFFEKLSQSLFLEANQI